ncbi:MAG: chemotaxis protein CheA [Gemmatimonadales bacterium]|nr:chemotaxis protein CheA [Gemmatimonadales bacterium]
MDVSKYAALFLAESREHLNACNGSLLEWERAPASVEPVDRLFRSIHTIKGMAATMGYAAVAQLAHSAENLLDALRHDRVGATPTVFQLLFRAVDALGQAVEGVAAGSEADADTLLIAELDSAATGDGTPAAAGPQSPVASRPATVGTAPPTRRASDAPRSRPVHVTIRPGALMRGARAALVLRRAEGLGEVSGLRPAVAQLERDEFDGRFFFRLQTRLPDAEITCALGTVGEVEAVQLQEPAAEVEVEARSRQIRVDLRRLDALMKHVGELVVAKNRLSALSVGAADPALVELGERIARLVSAMQTEVLAARMTPVGEVFERFPRLARDLSRDLGKRIRFDMEGEEIELDRSILDEIGDPLLHLIRNAADHGIEPPDQRTSAGKPAEGRILLSATRERNTVALRVVDDGRGIDRARILEKARREGLASSDVDTLTDDLLVRVLARPGFSTAASVSGVSGRGVGVDVAMTRVRALGGTLEVRSELGRGSTFLIRVPLTLAIVRALLAEAGGERYAVPLAYVAETVEFDRRAVTSVRDREALVVRDQVIPTIHLRDLVSAPSQGQPARQPTVILEVGERRTALVVDALLGQQDIVVEPFDAPRGMPPFVGGATILADGKPALILDAAALL